MKTFKVVGTVYATGEAMTKAGAEILRTETANSLRKAFPGRTISVSAAKEVTEKKEKKVITLPTKKAEKKTEAKAETKAKPPKKVTAKSKSTKKASAKTPAKQKLKKAA